MESEKNILQPSTRPLHVAVLVLDDSNTLSFAAAVDPLRAANRMAGRKLFAWQFVTAGGTPARLTSGIDVPGTALRRLDRCDLLIVIAGFRLADHATPALRASLRKICVFLAGVVTIAVIIGTIMYTIEGEQNGFTNIPTSIYWAIVTLTTVGYGDLSPQTPLGKILASVLMILGYGIIAVPTGIVTADIVKSSERKVSTQACPECSAEGHDPDARHCKYCGARL